ncbi:MAG: LPS export ABC transporter periplasmic protein LptC [Deltaproteobacteria bacterium]|nr:LPS export ABC transporter periplasmic protein LptC [Deltaproteobacteria bacterium]
MKRIRYILLAVSSLVFILVMVALVRNFLTPRDLKPLENLPPQGVSMQINDIHYEQTNQDAFKEWELDAQSAQYYKDENKFALQSIEVNFFSSKGKVYKLTAERGEFYTDSKDIKVSGKVVVVTDEGYHIQTDSFRYNAQQRKIFSDDEVTLSSEKMIMRGKGMVIDLDEERLYILKEVRALEKK